MIDLKQNLLNQVKLGMEGMSGTIAFPYKGLANYIDIAKNTNYLICADTGGGKTSFAHDLMINTLTWYWKEQPKDLKLSIIYLGMERQQYTYSAKWCSRMIFLETGQHYSVKEILGRKRDQFGNLVKLDAHVYELIEKYTDVFQKWQEDDTFVVFEGTHNPTGISKFIQQFAEKHGEIGEKEEGYLSKPKYTPTHSNHIVLFVTDYVGVLDAEKDETGVKKQRLDKYSATMRKARDVYGFSPINIQQLSRQVSSSDRLKMNDLKPKLADIADTSELARDADVVIAVFEPHRYVTESIETDLLGYSLKRLRDNEGRVFYRTLHILKNSFDASGLIIPMSFQPIYGIFKTIVTPAKLMTETDYLEITNSSYFLNN